MLGAMCALGAFSFDVYLPNLPDVVVDLGTTATMAQFTMTFMLLGGAAGQLVIGPLSDRFGRRRPALIGAACHVAACALCAFAPSIIVLIGFRTVMGFFNASVGVVAMAVIRDRFVGRDAARMISRLMLVIGAAPLLAPSIGGLVGQYFNWRAVFFVLGLYGVGLIVAMWFGLPETLDPSRRLRRVGSSFAGYGTLLRDRYFVALAMVPALFSVVLMTYVIASPFVLQEQYGLSKMGFALAFAINGVGLIGGAQVNAALVKSFSSSQILRVTAPASLLGCAVLFALGATGAGGLISVLVVLFLVLSMQNASPANAAALALTRHGERAGTAAACLGFAQNVLPALVSPLVGAMGNHAWAMGLVMSTASLCAVIVLVVATPLYRHGGAAALDRLPPDLSPADVDIG